MTILEKLQKIQNELKVHKGQKNYKCDECCKSFLSVHNLKQHIFLLHEGRRKDYNCEMCHKSFPTKSDLKRHVTSVH